MTAVHSTLPMAIFTYNEPDFSTQSKDNSRSGYPPNKSSRHETLPLRDMRIDPSITHGRIALDTHGFTYVTQKSALLSEECGSETAVRIKYIPEVEQIIRETTGAKKAIVVNVTFRNKKPISTDDTSQDIPASDESYKNLLQFSGPMGKLPE